MDREQTVKVKKFSFGAFYSEYGIYMILVVLIIFCSFLSEKFLTVANLLNIARQISVYALIALSEMILMICGEITLAAGSQLCMSGIISIVFYKITGDMLLSIVVAVFVGTLLGAVNGGIACYLGVPAFITTLATNLMFRGAINLTTGGQTISDIGAFNSFGQGYLLGIPIPVIVTIIVALISAFLLRNTILGRRLYAIGGNAAAAAATGVAVKKFKFIAFLISGALTGLAGAILLSRLNMGIPTAGQGYEMDAIAGAVIGGTSMSGGIGSAFGVLVGSLIIGIINNILNLRSISSYVQDIIKGMIIVGAVLIDIQTRSRLKA